MAETLGQFDVIALTELRAEVGDLKRIMDVLGPTWRIVYSDYNLDNAGNEECIGYLYDTRAATFTGLAAEADPGKTFASTYAKRSPSHRSERRRAHGWRRRTTRGAGPHR